MEASLDELVELATLPDGWLKNHLALLEATVERAEKAEEQRRISDLNAADTLARAEKAEQEIKNLAYGKKAETTRAGFWKARAEKAERERDEARRDCRSRCEGDDDMSEEEKKIAAASRKVREAERKHVLRELVWLLPQWGKPHGIPEHDGLKEARDRGLR